MATADTAHSSNSSSLTALIHEAGPRVLSAIKKASAATGVDFAYMLEKAGVESGMNSKAKSSTSSATGLYQFVDKTWMSMVKKYGDKCGLGHMAACIDSQGNVADKGMKQQILNLRKDPETSAMMAAEYTNENKAYMQQQLGAGTQVGPTELYLAHFLGAGGATSFMKAYQDNPLQQASDVAPKAANANRNIFYDSKTGQPRSLAAVYDLFAKKFGVDSSSDTEAQTADAAPASMNAMKGKAENAMTAMIMAQSGVDPDSDTGADPNDAVSAANLAATKAATISVASDGAAAADTNGETVVHWFSPRLSIARIESNTKLAALQSTMSSLPTKLASDPAHVMLMARHHAAPHHLAAKARATNAYNGLMS